MLNMDSQFVGFLDQMAKGRCTREDWKSFAVSHYSNPAIENARRTLVRAAIEADFVSSGAVPQVLQALARELSAKLSGEKLVTPV